MLRALDEFEIGDLKTLLPFHRALLQTEQWAAAETCRDLIEDRSWLGKLAFPPLERPVDGDGQRVEQSYTVEVSGNVVDYGISIAELGRSIQRNVKQAVERMTGLRVVEVNIAVDDVYLPTPDDQDDTPSRVS